jgi:AraC-like DNA-binding protein
VPVSKLLQAAGIRNIPQFRKKMNQLYHLNIREFITEIRMTCAMNLLKDPTLSIKEIAGLSGFKSAFYFSRVFTNYFGMAPKYFRDSLEFI